MGFAVLDFHRLRWSLLAAGLLAAVGAGAVAASLHMEQQAEQSFRQARAQQQDVRARLARIGDEEAVIRRQIGRYQEIVARGHLGRERRLEWIEAIGRIVAHRRLRDPDYELSPQHPLAEGLLPGGPGSHDFLASTMKLRLELLHEEDLLGFLGDLADKVPAVVQVRSCHVERLPPGSAERGSGARLRADCVIDWITLRERT
ncbi:MAG: hypothetical protein OEL88_08360 [Sterolibacteriaceae bacterium MAG5]|nr:hypothetical protein [Candidatus Nitricoxidireducens bremensis]